MLLLLCYFIGQDMGIRYLSGKEIQHAIAHVDLIVQIFTLQLIELKVQFALQLYLGHLSQLFAGNERSVKGANHVKVHPVSLLWRERQCDTVHLLFQSVYAEELPDHPVEYGTLSHAVHAAEDIHIGSQGPIYASLPTP